MRIAVIGAGRMGHPMAERLRAAGHAVTLLTRRPDAQAQAEADGFAWAGTIADTARDADLVLVVVLQDDQVRTVCLGPDGALAAMKPGAALIQHTTCDPMTVELLAKEGRTRGVRVLDAAISGGPHDIAAGSLTLWVGGDHDLIADLRPVLSAYASPIVAVGAPGAGQRVKLINNALFVAQVGLAIDAVRVADAMGIAEAAILDALRRGSGASRALGIVANAGSIDAVAGRLGALMRKDITVVRENADRLGLDLGVIGAVLASDVVERKVLDAPA